MSNLNLYVAFFQNPESGVMDTSNVVRSFVLGNTIFATFPPSRSAISIVCGLCNKCEGMKVSVYHVLCMFVCLFVCSCRVPPLQTLKPSPKQLYYQKPNNSEAYKSSNIVSVIHFQSQNKRQ